MAPQEQQRLAQARSINPEVHEAYLQGRYEWNKRTEEGLKKSAEYFQRAIAIDPGYAPAYSGLADSYMMLWHNGFLPPEQTVAEARSAALKAIEIDDNSAEAHTSLAYIVGFHDWNWDAAQKEFQRALELSPSYATAHHWYAWQLLLTKHQAEALDEIKKAHQLDPLSPRINANVGVFLFFERRYDEALEKLNEAVVLNPGDVATNIDLGMAYLQKGSHQQAITELTRASQLEPSGHAMARLAQAYGLLGERDRATKILEGLVEQSKRGYYPPSEIGFTYAALGDRDLAFTWLTKAYDDHDSTLVILQADPSFDFLRSDPRMQDLLHRAGLPL